MESTSIQDVCQAEIVRLHRFFVDWYHGRLPPTDEAWTVLTDALAPAFELIAPSGHVLAREPLLSALRGRHASHDSEGGFRIWIRGFDCRHVDERTVVATYEEWQHLDGEDRGRLSTVVFQRVPANSTTLRWLHVHETWLPQEPAEAGTDSAT